MEFKDILNKNFHNNSSPEAFMQCAFRVWYLTLQWTSQENYLYRSTLTKLKKGIKAAYQENWTSPPSWSLRHTAQKQG